MKKGKQVLAAVLAGMLLAGNIQMTAFAADKKVTSISLVVESNLQVGDEYMLDDVTVITKSDRYVVGDMEFLNEGYEWEATDTPELEVYIEATDGYYLSVAQKDIKVKGATNVRGSRVDRDTIKVTMKLPSMRESLGEMESVSWSGNTAGSWNEVMNAGYYDVRLYRNGESAQSGQKVYGTSVDFSSKMTKEGNYSFKVRAVNLIKEDKKSDWMESGEIFIDAETARKNRETYGNVTSGMTEPGQVITSQAKDGWNLDGRGWWYHNTDGTYPANNWQLIDGKWYFFDSEGYMKTGWVLWNHLYYYCDDASGAMLVNTTTPDGSRVDSAGVWIQK